MDEYEQKKKDEQKSPTLNCEARANELQEEFRNDKTYDTAARYLDYILSLADHLVPRDHSKWNFYNPDKGTLGEAMNTAVVWIKDNANGDGLKMNSLLEKIAKGYDIEKDGELYKLPSPKTSAPDIVCLIRPSYLSD